VFYKDGIVEFAKALIELGFEIVSSGGTAKHLIKEGVEGVIDVADITGVPAILSHRVVTLNHKIYAGILAELTPEHDADLEQFAAERFDIVCCDVYPVMEALTAGRVSVAKVMNMTDIGGPCMLRASAKNHNNCVTPICDPADRQRVIDDIIDFGRVTTVLNTELCGKTFDMTARYDAAIRNFMMAESGQLVDSIFLSNGQRLAYAENRDQNEAYIFSDGSDDPLAIHNFEVESGKPSYISYADGDQLIDILCIMTEAFRRFTGVPHIALAGKHGNPCGAGVSFHSPEVAIEKALMGDPVAVMGGEVVTNFPIDSYRGKKLFKTDGLLDGKRYYRGKWGLDIVFAPSFEGDSVEVLGEYQKRRLLSNPNLEEAFMNSAQWVLRPVRGGFLRQKRATYVPSMDSFHEWAVMTGADRTAFVNLVIAWATCWRASSNTVALAKNKMLIGLGCGQQDRIACVRLCVNRALGAGHSLRGSYFASDGFFPYCEGKLELIEKRKLSAAIKALQKASNTKDRYERNRLAIDSVVNTLLPLDFREGPEILRDNGCTGGIVPGDGKNLPLVKKFFDDAGMKVLFLPPIHRGFSKH